MTRLAEAGIGPAALHEAPRPFALYYGWPSLVNGAAGDVSLAASAFRGFREIVFGEGNVLEGADPRAGEVLGATGSLGCVPYGYVDLGITAGSRGWGEAELSELCWAWRGLGAAGVMFDCAGEDYGVTRSRLNSAVVIGRGLGLAVIVNAWTADDVLAGATPLRRGDGYLVEGALLSDGCWVADELRDAKFGQASRYRAELGVRVLAVATAPTAVLEAHPGLRRAVHRCLAPFGVDGIAFSDANYGADDNRLMAARAFPPDG